ncbi:MAG: hypothetical protein RR246_01775 [Clostridia bacterium]
MDYIVEALIIACSSTGLIGTIIAALFSKIMKNAKLDAEKRRAERLEAELIRNEYEEISGRLLLTISRFCRDLADETELYKAENEYAEFVNKMNRMNKTQYYKHLTEKV